MRRFVAAAALGACLALTLAGGGAAEEDVILAQRTPNVILIWRINDALDGLSAAQRQPERLTPYLLAQGEARMVAHLHDAPSPAATITLRLLYGRDAYDQRYGMPTLASMSPVGTLSAPAAALAKDGARWHAALLAGHVPPGFTAELDAAAVTRIGTSP